MNAPDSYFERDFEGILRSSADGFVRLDAEFHVRFANGAAVGLLGVSQHEMVGSSVTEFFQDMDVALISKNDVQGPEFSGFFQVRGSCLPESLLQVRVVRLADGYAAWLKLAETERERQLRQELAAVRAQANAVAEGMRSGLIVTDGAGKVLQTNPSARAMFGVSNAQTVDENVTGFEICDSQGGSLARADWPLERALRGHSSRDTDFQIRPIDSYADVGKRKPWVASLNTNCFYDELGQLQFVVALIRDISGLRETERVLHETEDRHRVAMEAAHLGTWDWDIKRNQLYWSDRCRILYGLRPDAPVNIETYRACIYADDRRRADASATDCLARPGELIEVEYRVRWADGSIHWLQSWKQSRLGSDGQPDLVTGVVVNIDERKAVEEELRQTAGALRAIIDGSPMGIVATDAEGAVKIWNPAAERTLGFQKDEVLGKPSPLPFGGGLPVHDREYRVQRADGREIEMLCSVAAIVNAGGDNAGSDSAGSDAPGNGSVAMFLDITERQRLRRRAEHVQKMESLTVLAGGVAHDFNNLLTGILGNASLCLYTTDTADERYELLQEVLNAGDRATALTHQLLAYTGQGRFSVTRIDLGDVARKISTSAQLPGRRIPISVHLELDPRMPSIEADAGQIQQVVLSLLMNSAEAIDGNTPGTIWIRTRNEFVSEGTVLVGESAETLPSGSYAILEVEDTGSGMDKPTLARIFEPFFSTKFTGRGLGLPAVLGIVRQHGGAITAQSTRGRGSIFRAYFPSTVDQASGSAPRQSGGFPGAGQILVVDDEETVRTTIRRSLEHWGYEVVLAENGQVAVDVFPSLAHDLRAVFLDLTMPVMGGEEALGHFRRIKPNLPVILISGYGEIDGPVRVSPGGASSFLQKPFTPEQLGQKLFEVLDSFSRGKHECN